MYNLKIHLVTSVYMYQNLVMKFKKKLIRVEQDLFFFEIVATVI